MQSFEFCNPVRVHFGNGIRHSIGRELSGKYRKALLVCSKGPFRTNGLLQEIRESLEKENIQVTETEDIESNPKISQIRAGVGLCREEGADCIIALGSGSAVDAAKAMGAATAMGIDPWELYWGKERPEVDKSVDTIMVPTMASTGAEMNRSSVAVDDVTKEKYFFDSLFPKQVFMDPEITVTVPVKLTIWAVMDILSHTFEYYFNGFLESEFQTRLSEGIIQSVMFHLERVIADPGDLVSRGELMWAAAFTWGTGLTWIGRGEPDMACHGIEESFSGYFDTHHGACLGVLTPRWMERVAVKRADIFARFARNIMGIQEGDDARAAFRGVERYKEWLKKVGAPNTFYDISDREFSDRELEHVAETASRIYRGGVGRLVRFSKDDILELLREGKKAY